MLKPQTLQGVRIVRYGLISLLLICFLRCPFTIAEKYDLEITRTTLNDFANHTFRMNWTQTFSDWTIEFNITQTTSILPIWKPFYQIFLRRDDQIKQGVVKGELSSLVNTSMAMSYSCVIPEYSLRLPSDKCTRYESWCIELSVPAYLKERYTINDNNHENNRQCVKISRVCEETIIEIETRLHRLSFASIEPKKNFQAKFDVEIANKSPYMLKLSTPGNDSISQLNLVFVHKQLDELKTIPFSIREPLGMFYIKSSKSTRLQGSADLRLLSGNTCKKGFSNEICVTIIPKPYSAIKLNQARGNAFLCKDIVVDCTETDSELPVGIVIGVSIAVSMSLVVLVVIIYRKKKFSNRSPTIPPRPMLPNIRSSSYHALTAFSGTTTPSNQENVVPSSPLHLLDEIIVNEIEDVVPDNEGSYCHHRMKESKAINITIERYDMDGVYKGCAFILNNEEFEQQRLKRKGSEKDFKNIIHTFEELGFQVERQENKTAQQIKISLQTFTKRFSENRKYKASVVVLMSHGNSTGICGTDGRVVKINDIQKMFDSNSCPQLEGKPKLFFIQACRVPVEGRPVSTVIRDAPLERERVFAENGVQNADMHLAFATVDGFSSWRSARKGSWFVNALVEVFFAKAHEDNFSDLMLMVRRRVGNQRGRLRSDESKELLEVHMTPECRTTLQKALYFMPVGHQQ